MYINQAVGATIRYVAANTVLALGMLAQVTIQCSTISTAVCLSDDCPMSVLYCFQRQGELVYQTDIVPTVSRLLGVPIPFSSLGMVLPDLFHRPSGLFPLDGPGTVSLDLLQSLHLNMEQVHLYLKALVKHDHSFSSPAVDSLMKVYLSAVKRYTDVKGTKEMMNETVVDSVASEMKAFIRGVRAVCVEKWAKFNDTYINIGISLLLVHIVLVCVMLVSQSKPSTPSLHLRMTALLVMVRRLKAVRFRSIDVTSCVSVFVAVFHSFSLFSNSFVVYEQSVVIFSTQSLMLVLALGVLRQTIVGRDTRRFKEILGDCFRTLLPYCGVMVCVRLSAVFHSCRDQQDECTVVEFLKPYSKYSDSASLVNTVLKVVGIGASVCLYRVAVTHFERTVSGYLSCKRCQTIHSSLSFAWARESVSAVLVILLFEEIFRIVSVVAAWIVYVVFMVGLVGVAWRPWWYIKGTDCQRESDFTRAWDDVHCLYPVAWLLMIVIAPVTLVVAVPNDSYLPALGVMVLQLSLTVAVIQDSPRGRCGEEAVK